MNVFVVYAHPEQSSYNAILNKTAVETLENQGHTVVLSDLYRMGFEPVASRQDFLDKNHPISNQFREEQKFAYEQGLLAEDILDEQRKLKWCDFLILQFPLWWYSMPAILKGWIDRVLTPGFAYDRKMRFNHGGLRGKKAMILLTTGSSETAFSWRGINGPIGAVLFPIQYGTLYYVGFDVLPPFIAWQPSRQTEEQRSLGLTALQNYLVNVDKLSPIPYPKVEESDEDSTLKIGYDWSETFNLNLEE